MPTIQVNDIIGYPGVHGEGKSLRFIRKINDKISLPTHCPLEPREGCTADTNETFPVSGGITMDSPSANETGASPGKMAGGTALQRSAKTMPSQEIRRFRHLFGVKREQENQV